MRFKIILESKMEKCYSIDRRGATAHKVVDRYRSRNSTLSTAKYQGGFSMYGYLQNVKTNVSNAKRKRPKVNKSLKSKLF